MRGLENDGADPFVGRKMRTIMRSAGVAAEIGIHAGVWDIQQLRREFDDEWKWVEMTVGEQAENVAEEESNLPENEQPVSLKALKAAWEAAIDSETLFQFNPIFYAIGRK